MSYFETRKALTPRLAKEELPISLTKSDVALVLALALLIFTGCAPSKKTKRQWKLKCIVNMRMLEGTVDLWKMDNPKTELPSGDFTEDSELTEIISLVLYENVPLCESGGLYSYDSSSNKILCSKHGSISDINFMDDN